MDAEFIKERVEHIKRIKGDDEDAHSTEDMLHQTVLEYISKEAPEPWSTLAGEALKTRDIDFARWCA